MDQVEQALLERLPQTLMAGELDHFETLAMEEIKRYFLFTRGLPPFLKSNSLIDPELVEVIKFSVTQKNWSLLKCAAVWLTLTIAQRAKLKERLEMEFPDPSLWQL